MPIQNLSVLRGMGRHPQHLRIFFTGHAGVPHGAVEIAGIAAVEQDVEALQGADRIFSGGLGKE